MRGGADGRSITGADVDADWLPDGVANGIAERITDGLPNGISDGGSNSIADGNADSVPNCASDARLHAGQVHRYNQHRRLLVLQRRDVQCHLQCGQLHGMSSWPTRNCRIGFVQ